MKKWALMMVAVMATAFFPSAATSHAGYSINQVLQIEDSRTSYVIDDKHETGSGLESILQEGKLTFSALQSTSGITEIVSVSSDGTSGDDDSSYPSISSDGRYVAFHSAANNLVPGDTNSMNDVFVHDRFSGTTEIISVGTDGSQGNGSSDTASISGDGRYVTFVSDADTLVPNDANGYADIFVHDRDTQQTDCISMAYDGGHTANSDSFQTSISGNGRFIAFISDASDIVPGDINSGSDVFVYDQQMDKIELVSVSSEGSHGNDSSYESAISFDGRYVAFSSSASNLVAADVNNLSDIFVHDLQNGETEMVSITTDGMQVNGWSYLPSISADGRFVAFHSYSSDLVTGDTNNSVDVFVHDRQTGVTERVSIASDGSQGNNESTGASISSDGRFIAFESTSTNLVGDAAFGKGIYVRDRLDGTTIRVSVDNLGYQLNYDSLHASISADGQVVAFYSWDKNLWGGAGTDYIYDVLVHDQNGTIFADVPASHPLFEYIRALYIAGYTSGCGTDPLRYCPDSIMDRAESAVFMLRGQVGTGYTPGTPTGILTDDWELGTWAEAWAESMISEGLSSGCWEDPLQYCPWTQLTRQEASVFGLRLKYGMEYTPPGATGTLFADMTDAGFWSTAWAEQAYQDGLLPECGWEGDQPLFCPEDLVDRGWGAYLIVTAKDLLRP